MTLINVAFHYRIQPTESQISAMNRLRDVYGVRRLTLDEKERTLRIDYDASRLSECEVAGLLRNAGIDVLGKLALTWDRSGTPADEVMTYKPFPNHGLVSRSTFRRQRTA